MYKIASQLVACLFVAQLDKHSRLKIPNEMCSFPSCESGKQVLLVPHEEHEYAPMIEVATLVQLLVVIQCVGRFRDIIRQDPSLFKWKAQV